MYFDMVVPDKKGKPVKDLETRDLKLGNNGAQVAVEPVGFNREWSGQAAHHRFSIKWTRRLGKHGLWRFDRIVTAHSAREMVEEGGSGTEGGWWSCRQC
jgi:hypothetical protein